MIALYIKCSTLCLAQGSINDRYCHQQQSWLYNLNYNLKIAYPLLPEISVSGLGQDKVGLVIINKLGRKKMVIECIPVFSHCN